jgi:hypothetical protein
MVLLFEEIVVELVAIAAPLVALACLIYIIAMTFLERRELRRLAASRVRENRESVAVHGHAPERSRAQRLQGSGDSHAQLQG